jgi:hypothetical protein
MDHRITQIRPQPKQLEKLSNDNKVIRIGTSTLRVKKSTHENLSDICGLAHSLTMVNAARLVLDRTSGIVAEAQRDVLQIAVNRTSLLLILPEDIQERIEALARESDRGPFEGMIYALRFALRVLPMQGNVDPAQEQVAGEAVERRLA